MSRKTLYHYCSMDSFKSIIEGKSLRMSSLTMSNDSSEGKVIRNLFMDLAKNENLSEIVEHEIRNGLIQLEKNLEGIGFCLSENGDLLDQWRVYASNGEGVAIGLSTEKLESLTGSHTLAGLNLQLKPVIYKKKDQLEAILPLFEYIRDRALEWEKNTTPSLAETIIPTLADRRKNPKPDNFYDFGSLEFVINQELFFLKHPCFSNEREHRLYSVIKNDALSTLDFYLRNGSLIPCKSVRFHHGSESPFIAEVVLGSKCRTSESLIKAFLDKNNITNVRIRRSSLPHQ